MTGSSGSPAIELQTVLAMLASIRNRVAAGEDPLAVIDEEIDRVQRLKAQS